MIEARVPPFTTGGFEEDAAGREFGAYDVIFGSRPARVECVLAGESKRQRCQNE
jgi:hypothetical protein